jgi:ABC-type transport system involved in multi-copper enzyme maturation permease subunit
MNYYAHFARQTLAEGLKSAYVYLISALFSILAVIILKNAYAAALLPGMMEALGNALVFNGLLPVSFISIYLCARPVFFAEKKQKTLTMVLCSPAGLAEVFWGKAAGLVLSAFLTPMFFVLASIAVFAPHAAAAMFSLKTLAALAIVAVIALAFTALIGIALLSSADERIVNVVVYLSAMAQFWLAKLTKAAAGRIAFGGVFFQYTGIMAGFIVLAAAAYFLYFSKLRIVESA